MLPLVTHQRSHSPSRSWSKWRGSKLQERPGSVICLNCVEKVFSPSGGEVILEAEGTGQNQRTEEKEHVCLTQKDPWDLELSSREEGCRIFWDGMGRGQWAYLERRWQRAGKSLRSLPPYLRNLQKWRRVFLCECVWEIFFSRLLLAHWTQRMFFHVSAWFSS